ncbi:hypothetical protein E3O53_02465 [Cryobacterium sp. TMT2-18-3]|uniref:hypothetical protein n=1 Tax=unclassified Cryobacterium TaxID=2649013 RepID=UPI00106D2677|nr:MULTISPECIES: hypothetical protein [unclassified Cryobacterium]TFC27167.1 hypothetical protein E3O22_10010 [Cryobacterium sp. TMT2-18-2]TFC34631.1 hypothetical protein E3O18_11005 [Cryobacterium sp. TMT2-42-4]TFC67501.1 hypothetical protein E3O53_02465 [Cryobacterium sp. TMT2-18-3]
MVRSAMAVRRRLAGLEWLLIAALVATGVWFGVQGTAVAKVDSPTRLGWDIEIAQTGVDGAPGVAPQRDVIVWFSWAMASDGLVEIRANSSSAGGLSNSAFTIILYCGAQLSSLDGAAKHSDGTGIQDIRSAGDEAACNASERGETEERKRQVVRVVGSAWFSGIPEGRWSDSRAGQRIARTPLVGYSSTKGELIEASALSTARTVLTAPVTEQFDSATPPESVEGSVVYGSGWPIMDQNGNRETAAVQWETTAKDENTLTMPLETGIARWTLPEGQAFPQWSLLFSGVLFGVAAALIVEWPIAAYRARLRSSAEAAAKAEADEGDHRR